MDSQYLRKLKEHRMNAWNGKKQARWYARDVNDFYTFENIDLDTQVRLVSSVIPEGSRLADIGCGTGALALALSSCGYEMTGFDISLPMLDQLRRRDRGRKIILKEADIFDLDPSFGPFDGAVSRWVLPLFPNWAEITRSVARVVRPGGIFVFDMYSREHQDFVSAQKASGEGGLGNQPSDQVEAEAHIPRRIHSSSAASIEVELEKAGFELLGLHAFGLFAAGNKLLSGSLEPKELEKRAKAVAALLRKSEPLRHLIQSLEENVTPHIPQHLLFRTLVVARRK